jgi:hypothetical protein
MLRQHPPAVLVDFDLADGGHTCPLQAKFQPADAAEQ